MNAYQQAVPSNPSTQFVQAIAQNEISQNEELTLPGKQAHWFIRGFEIVATQNLAYELWLFSSAVNLDGTLLGDKLVGLWAFGVLAAQDPGWTVTPVGGVANGLFHYYIDGNMIPYVDRDVMAAGYQGNAHLHLRLVNRSAGAKSAAGAGALIITPYCSIQGQQV
jgi:hypothetical protein